MTPSVVRRATMADYDDLWRLFLQAHHENGIFKLSHGKVDFFMRRALEPEKIHPADNGPRGMIAVIGPPGSLEAMCFVIIGEFWYSEEKHIEELIVYVDPVCRRSEHAKTLIGWMKKTADALEIPLFTGVISTERTDAKLKLYDRQLPRIGGFFCYPLPKRHNAIKKLNHNMDKEAWISARQ